MKIKIDETGNFGTPINPFIVEIDDDTQTSEIKIENWIEFDKSHPKLILTCPQLPLSVVDGKSVRQIENTHKTWSILTEPEIPFYTGSNAVTRVVYHIPKTIDGFAVGSEIKTDMSGVALSPVDDYYKEMRKRIGEENKGSVEEIAKEYSESGSQEPFMYNIEQYKEAKYFSFIAGYNADKENELKLRIIGKICALDEFLSDVTIKTSDIIKYSFLKDAFSQLLTTANNQLDE